MKKKLVSLFLIIALTLSVVTPCLAAETTLLSDRAPLEDVLAYIQTIYPGAQVTVDENNILQILVEEQQPQMLTARAALTSTYAPNGGSYRYFTAPPGTDPYSPMPWSIVYLPAEQTVALLSAKLSQDLFEDVISLAGSGISISGIVASIYTTFGVWLGPAGVVLILAIGTYNVMSWIDEAMLVTVTNNYSRISIERTTTMGWPSNYYSGWVGNYVTAAPYELWYPTFYSSVYDI